MWCLSLNNFIVVKNVATMNRVELAVCRIREKLPGNEGLVTKGSACVAHCERIASSWGWKCQNFIVSSSVVLCKEDFSSPDKIFIAEFLSKDKKSLEVFELRLLAEVSRDVPVRNLILEDNEKSLSFISVEPLDKRGFLKKMVKKSTLQTFRPLDCADFEKSKLEDELRDGLYCHVVVDSFEPTNAPFVTKTLKLVYDFQTRQFNLQDFGGFERVHDKEEIPTGAVITTRKGECVGILDFVDNVVSPLFFHESRIADIDEKNGALNNNSQKEEIKVDDSDVGKCKENLGKQNSILDGSNPSETSDLQESVGAELSCSNGEASQVSEEKVTQDSLPRNDNSEILRTMVTVEKGVDLRVNNGTKFAQDEDNNTVTECCQEDQEGAGCVDKIEDVGSRTYANLNSSANPVPDMDLLAEPLEEHPVRPAVDAGDKTAALTPFSEFNTSEIASECESRAVGHDQQEPGIRDLEASNKTILSSETDKDLVYTVIHVGETFSDAETTTLESVKLVNEETAAKESDIPEPGSDCEREKDKVHMDEDEFHKSSDSSEGILDNAANGLYSLENTNSDCMEVETVTSLAIDQTPITESGINAAEEPKQNVQITSDNLDENDLASDKTNENGVPFCVACPVEDVIETKAGEADKVNGEESDNAEKLEDAGEIDNSTGLLSASNLQREGIDERTQNIQCNGEAIGQSAREVDIHPSEHSALSEGLKRDKEESLQINIISEELDAKQENARDELSLSLQEAETCKGEKVGEVQTVDMREITDDDATSEAAMEKPPEVKSVEGLAGEQEEVPLNIVIKGMLAASADAPSDEQHSKNLPTKLTAVKSAANLEQEEMSHQTVPESLLAMAAESAANLEQEEMSHKTGPESLPTTAAESAANVEQEEMSQQTVPESLLATAPECAANLEQEEMSHKTVPESLPTTAAESAANLEQEEMSHKTVPESLLAVATESAVYLEHEEMSHKTFPESLPATAAESATNLEQEEMSHKTVPESVPISAAKSAVNLEREEMSHKTVPDKDLFGDGISPQGVNADSLLTDTITNNPQALRDLGQCLNTEYQYGRIPCWRDLAELLGIPAEVYEPCSSYSENSPTEDLFAFLAATKPQLTLKDVIDALRQIDRHDVVYLLDRKIGSGVFSDESPVGSLVEREDTDVLGQMAVKLDKKCKNNWKPLALQLTVPRRVFRNFGSHTRHNSALMLMKFIPIFDPELTIRDLKDSLDSIHREDVVGILDGAGIPGDDQVKDILDDTVLLEQITDLLNDDPHDPHWRQLAGELGIPDEKCKIFEPVEDNRSPITLLFKSIENFDPDLTFEELILALVAMKRQDALDVLQKYFSSEDIGQILEENNLVTPAEEKLNLALS